MSLCASKGRLTNSSSGQSRTASWVESASTAAEIPVEVLSEDATHAV